MSNRPPGVNRRSVLGLAAGGMASLMLGNRLPAAAPRAAAPHEWTVIEAARAIATRAISAQDYVTALIARFDEGAALNAFISRDDSELVAAAGQIDVRLEAGVPVGALAGVPVLPKDNIETAGLPTSGGTGALAGDVTGRTAPVLMRLFNADALLAGKANMHELAASGGTPCVVPPAVNPYDTAMRAGGSSSGSAVALAARLVPAALGTDTGGSVRIPAALCGVAGLRPTMGRYPGRGIIPISPSRDTAGPMARDIGDLALLDRIISGESGPDAARSLKGIRLGVPSAYFFDDIDGDLAAVIDAAFERLRKNGVVLVRKDIPGVGDFAQRFRAFLARHEIGRSLPAYIKDRPSGIALQDFLDGICDPKIRDLVESKLEGDLMPAEALAREIRRRQAEFLAVVRGYFTDHRVDAIVFPTTPLPARPQAGGDEVMLNGRKVSAMIYNRNTMPGSSIGLPGVTVPAGLTVAGLPVGLGLDGLPGRDRDLLALAAAIESALPAIPPPRPLLRKDETATGEK